MAVLTTKDIATGQYDGMIKDSITANVNNPQAIQNAMSQYGVSPQDVVRAFGEGARLSDVTDYFADNGLSAPYLNDTYNTQRYNNYFGLDQPQYGEGSKEVGNKPNTLGDATGRTSIMPTMEAFNAGITDINKIYTDAGLAAPTGSYVADGRWVPTGAAASDTLEARNARAKALIAAGMNEQDAYLQADQGFWMRADQDTPGQSTPGYTDGLPNGTYAPANYMASMYGRQQTQSQTPQQYSRPQIERLSDADYDKLQNDLVTGYTAPLQRYEELAKQAADEDLAKRGIWSSGIATRAQGDIAERMAPQYAQLGATATDKRYALEQNDINAYNQLNQGYYNTDVQNATANRQIDTSYDLGLRNNALGYYTADQNYDLGQKSAATNQYQAETGRQQTANNYALGLGQLDLGYMTQNDNYAVQQAQIANDAAYKQAQAAWQAQWDPATYLAGLWNGTGGVISSSSAGGMNL